ncbi:MAG TPA: hypothetical protein VNP93_14435 [Gaiellaceae bacterium]|nr:hypothetical protein [Gaiellaceae bacterium]
MRLVLIVLVCGLLVGCSGDGDDSAARRDVPAPPTLTDAEERDFAAGVLEPGDVVRCRAGGLLAEVVVEEPRTRAFKQTTHAWEKDGSKAQLSLDFRSSGRIVASCSQ